MANVSEAKRQFKYNQISLADPDPGMSAEDVRSFYSNVYPELTQATIEGPEYKPDGIIEYRFQRAVGTKG